MVLIRMNLIGPPTPNVHLERFSKRMSPGTPRKLL